LEGVEGEVLDGEFVIEAEAGGGGSGLAEDHEDGFHADGAIGDVGGGDADGDEEVFAFGFFRDDGAVVDGVGAAGAALDVALVAGVAVFVDVALHVVGVHVVGAHADGAGGGDVADEVVLVDDDIGEHAAGFADVELVGPVAVVLEFVLGEAPGGHAGADVFGDARVVGDEPKESLLVGFVLGDDLGAAFVGGFGVVVVVADVVEGETAVVVGVCFMVRDGVELAENAFPSGEKVAEEEFVLFGVVALGFGEGEAVGVVVGHAGAEAVGLDAVVGGELLAGIAVVDAGEEAGGGNAGDEVGIDGLVELVGDGAGGLDTVAEFAVGGVGLAADGVADLGGGHEVTFVGGVDEHAGRVGGAGEGLDGEDAAILEFDAVGALEPFVAEDGDIVFADEVFEDLFGDVWFEDPHGAGAAVGGRGALALVAVFGLFLPVPGLVLIVVEVNAVVEVAGEAADDLLSAGIGPAEAAGAEAAEMFVGADDEDGFPHFFGLHGGGDGGGGAAVDEDVVDFAGGGGEGEGGEEQEFEGGEHDLEAGYGGREENLPGRERGDRGPLITLIETDFRKGRGRGMALGALGWEVDEMGGGGLA